MTTFLSIAADDAEIVSALQNALIEKVGQRRYDLWFGANTRLALRDTAGPAPRLCVSVPTRFFQEWMRNNFRAEVESCCAALLDKPVSVTFQIDESLAEPAPAASEAPCRAQDSSHDQRALAVSRSHRAVVHPAPSAPQAATAKGASPAPRPAFFRRYAALEQFVEGPGNRLALATARMVVEQPGQLSPLVLHGPTGVGKTHLLEGILAASARRGQTALYMSAEQFTSAFLEAVHGSGMPNFRRKYRGVDVFIVDDIQFFAGKTSTLGELLHTVDTLARSGKQVVFGCDRAPAELVELGAELTARLSGGMVCKLDPPDYETRRGILRTMLTRQEWSLPEEVQEFIAGRFTHHARELIGALNRLRATSTAWQREVDLDFAMETLADLAPTAQRQVQLADVERAVCEVFGVSAAQLKSENRSKRNSQPRMLAMWLARKHTRSALSEICDHFGRKSHATVISAEKRVNRWREQGDRIDLADHLWKADDAIRKVEERLKLA